MQLAAGPTVRQHAHTEPGAAWLLARPKGVEPPTLGSEVRCSVQLSYGRAEVEYVIRGAPPVQSTIKNSSLDLKASGYLSV